MCDNTDLGSITRSIVELFGNESLPILFVSTVAYIKGHFMAQRCKPGYLLQLFIAESPDRTIR
jgi:hypothetical protein